MKKTVILISAVIFLLSLTRCSNDSAEKIRYDMEKLAYAAGRAAERINVQRDLTTAQDSLKLKSACQAVLDYYIENRNRSEVAGNKTILSEMEKMAISASVQLAKYYIAHRELDSVIAAYRRIGADIPADKNDLAGANLALALTYRSAYLFDSTLALYDAIIADYYPPADSLDRINTDVISLPIDKIDIARAMGDSDRVKIFARQALDYYSRLKTEYPNSLLFRTAAIYAARIHAMNKDWDKAVDQLKQIKDSTGQVEVRAAFLIANIYNDSKKEVDKAIEMYQEIIGREPDSSVIGGTMLRLGAALCSQKNYEEGRKTLAELKKKFARYPQLTARAQLFYARAFESQGRWERALSEYQWLMENHPYTEDAFQAALHIPDHFAAENDDKLAEIWYDRAVEFYLNAAQKRQNQPIAVAANMFLADVHGRTGRWKEAVDSYDKIYSMVPKTRTGAMALFNAARVAFNQLEDSTLAQTYLDRLRAEFGTSDSTSIHRDDLPEIDLKSLEE
jgi:tetratricopeptide (TPR) repeat protein